MRQIWMRCASFLWSSLNRAARFALKQGWLKRVELSARVISVGNIQAGGAGKTPLVAQIAQEAHDQGLSVCILTRGYLGGWEKTGGVILPSDSNVDPQLCGDEPALLHELIPFAWIGVGADRVKQYAQVVECRNGIPPDLVILDDGFQNLKIKKDVEVVALTHYTPGDLVFREGGSALRDAHLLVWTKGEVLPSWVSDLADQRLCRVAYALQEMTKWTLPSRGELRRCWLVTSIADSQSAYDLFVQSGIDIVKHTALTDHFNYSKESIQSFLKQACAEHLQIVMTGKDWVKWRAWGVRGSEVRVFEPKLRWVFGREAWDRVLWGK